MINGTNVTAIREANGLSAISRENTSFKCSRTGMWLEIIAVSQTIHHIHANILYQEWNSQFILSSDMWLPEIAIIANENRIAINVTVNQDDKITLRILMALDHVLWYNNGIALILLKANRVIPYTLKLWKKELVGVYTLPPIIPELHMISPIHVKSIMTIAASRLSRDFVDINPKYPTIIKYINIHQVGLITIPESPRSIWINAHHSIIYAMIQIILLIIFIYCVAWDNRCGNKLRAIQTKVLWPGSDSETSHKMRCIIVTKIPTQHIMRIEDEIQAW